MALDLPDDARGRLADWRDRAVAGRDDLRPVAAGALHVTMVFLGYLPEKEAPRIIEAIATSAAGASAPSLCAGELTPVPPRRPRLFALDLDDAAGRATALQAALAERLVAGRLYEPEKRPFWPHLTLARVKRGRRAEPIEAPPAPGDRFEAIDLTLYRSTLRPQGALYEPLARERLGG